MNPLTKFQIWLLKRIFKSAVVQGYHHTSNIATIYSLLRQAACDEFTEDNEVTIDDFLRENFESTQWTDRYLFLKEQLTAGTKRWAAYNINRNKG